MASCLAPHQHPGRIVVENCYLNNGSDKNVFHRKGLLHFFLHPRASLAALQTHQQLLLGSSRSYFTTLGGHLPGRATARAVWSSPSLGSEVRMTGTASDCS